MHEKNANWQTLTGTHQLHPSWLPYLHSPSINNSNKIVQNFFYFSVSRSLVYSPENAACVWMATQNRMLDKLIWFQALWEIAFPALLSIRCSSIHAPCDNDDTMIQNGKMTNYEHINDTTPFATVRKGKKWICFMIIIITLSLSLLASSPSYPVSFLSHQKWLIVFAHKLPFSQFHYHESKDENDQFPFSHFSITQFPIFKWLFVCIVQGDASRGDNH